MFPHHCLRQVVWVKDNEFPTKYGQCLLSWGELAMLWDDPILFMALFFTTSTDVSTLERLLAFPPTKFVELCTDQLLTGFSLGGLVRH